MDEINNGNKRVMTVTPLCLNLVGFQCTDFYETHSCSVALHGDLLYEISPSSVKNVKYRGEIHVRPCVMYDCQ